MRGTALKELIGTRALTHEAKRHGYFLSLFQQEDKNDLSDRTTYQWHLPGRNYALFAIGYTIIVGVVGLVSFTFGEVIMIGAFAALFTATLTGGNILLTILFSFAASGLIGIVIHKICYEKFFESARYIPLICTIGMSMLIKNTVQILFGSETKAMPEVIPLGGIQIGNYRITYVQCTVMVVVTVLCILLSIFLNKTKQGVILRAVSQDRKAAAMVGIDVSGATLWATCWLRHRRRGRYAVCAVLRLTFGFHGRYGDHEGVQLLRIGRSCRYTGLCHRRLADWYFGKLRHCAVLVQLAGHDRVCIPDYRSDLFPEGTSH